VVLANRVPAIKALKQLSFWNFVGIPVTFGRRILAEVPAKIADAFTGR